MLRDQRPAARLAERVGAKPGVDVGQLLLDLVDLPQPDADHLPAGARRIEPLEVRSRRARQQPAFGLRQAQVEQHGVHALLPLGADLGQRLPQAHRLPQVSDVRRRDPRRG